MKLAKLPNGEPELFYTIQGEGVQTGQPSIFLRLSLCNLHCRWCDTPYTWNWEGTPWEHDSPEKYQKSEQIVELSENELVTKLTSFSSTNLVITGGEPLLQQADIAKLIALLPHDWSVEIETNGTIIPTSLLDHQQIQYNVSPKLAHSGNPASLALKPNVLKWFSEHKKSFFKFVISSPEDIALVQELERTYQISPAQIILMPRGTATKEIQEHALSIVEHCLEHGYRYSDRLHVHLWGNMRAK